MQDDLPEITATRARLVSAEPRFADPSRGRRVFRPLVIRPAILVRPSGTQGSWRVDVEDGLLLPACPPTVREIMAVVRYHESVGRTCRLTAALALPVDSRDAALRRFAGTRRPCLDMFGWAITYQLPGTTGTAVVDGHEYLAPLPAFYECPLQLIDRSEFLTARGIRHRPLAIVVRPEDVAAEPSEVASSDRRHRRARRRTDRNRPGPTPCSISDLLGLRR